MEQIAWTTALGFLVSVGVYTFQKWRDRQDQIRARNFDTLVEMMDAIGRLASAFMDHHDMDQAQDAYTRARMKFSVIASDNALKSLAELNAVLSTPGGKPSEILNKALVELIREARIANLGKSFVSDEILLATTPFYSTKP